MWHSERHEQLWQVVAAQMPQDDIAHDAEHVARVYRWCLRLAEEGGADPELVGAAGLVHDLVDIPKDHPDRPLGGERSAEAAADLLPGMGYQRTEVEAIVEAVRTCSWSRGLTPSAAEGRVLQDADRLDAIGVIGLARCFATGQRMCARTRAGAFYDPADPDATARELDDRHYSLDHVATKMRKLPAAMHTATARAEAALRMQALEAAVAALRREIG